MKKWHDYVVNCGHHYSSAPASTVSPLDLFLDLSDQQRLSTGPGLWLGTGFTGRRPVSFGAAPPEQGAHALRPHVQDGV